MRALLLLVLLFVPMSLSAQEATVPYIYYYSDALRGIVVERADGTDSRVLGNGLVEEDVSRVYGAGWSPDGLWFAWQVQIGGFWEYSRAYAVSVDGRSLDILDAMPCVYWMEWSPDGRYLLIYGEYFPRADQGCSIMPITNETYWLIDTTTGTRVATYSIIAITERGRNVFSRTHWNRNSVAFGMTEQFFNDTDTIVANFYQITMSSDGNVRQDLVYQSIYRDGQETVRGQPYSISETAQLYGSDTKHFASITEPFADQLYSYDSTSGSLLHTENDSRILLPPNSRSILWPPISVLWHSSEWVLVGYDLCAAGCVEVTGEVSIFHPASGQTRELSDCGEDPACVGWLPDFVDVSSLPAGQATSVVVEPSQIEYTSFRGYLWLDQIANHQIACYMGKMSLVQDRHSEATIFQLPDGERCFFDRNQRLPEPEIVVFALSPNEQFYAITDSTENTTLYDASTGTVIATLNFYGAELSFSPDSRYLITGSRFAIATWDIETLKYSQPLDR